MSFRDINRGPQLANQHKNYQNWLKSTPEQRQAAYKAVAKPKAERVKPERVPVYLNPFNLTSTTVLYETRGLSATQVGTGNVEGAMLRKIVGVRALAEPPEGREGIPVPRYRFARISATNRTGTAKENHVSRITKNPYTYYTTNTVSTPFGQTGTENYGAAVTAMKDNADYKAFVKNPGDRIGFTPEG